MFDRIVKHMATLAECREIALATVGRIMIEVRAGQNHSRRPHGPQNVVPDHICAAAAAVSPAMLHRIPPAPVTEVANKLTVGPRAMVATSLGSGEPNEPRQLEPVDRIKPAMFGTDGHRVPILSHLPQEQKQKLRADRSILELDSGDRGDLRSMSRARSNKSLADVFAQSLKWRRSWRHGWGVQTPKQEPVRFDRVADAYVQATRLKAFAPNLL